MLHSKVNNYPETDGRRKVAVVTGTRAEWGLLRPIVRLLDKDDRVDLTVVATNMHLDIRYGNTVAEIEKEGFGRLCRVPIAGGDSRLDKVKAMSECLTGMGEVFDDLRPDLIVLLGDRYEIHATATAALMEGIPIAHIHGGEISEGAVDDALRHSITKMSSLHMTSTEEYRQRVIQMGESPDRVFNTGAPGVFNAMQTRSVSRSELEDFLGLKVDRKTILVTYHPATMESPEVVAGQIDDLIAGIDGSDASTIIFTYPNNDAGGRVIIDRIESYGRSYPGRVRVVPSLGQRRYMSLLDYVGAVVGNSSSGIIEVPSKGIPSVDIGIRQKGRIAAGSVIHCGNSTDEIREAVNFALSDDGRRVARDVTNPYYRDDTPSVIAEIIATYPLDNLTVKRFFDIERAQA